MLAVAVALALGVDSNAVAAGLFGFSPVLTAIAVGTVFHAPQPRVVVYTAAATIFTVIVQAALNVVFLPIGIPTLTAPFVAVAWLFLVPRRDLTPCRMSEAAAASFTRSKSPASLVAPCEQS
jgi:urea transporter